VASIVPKTALFSGKTPRRAPLWLIKLFPASVSMRANPRLVRFGVLICAGIFLLPGASAQPYKIRDAGTLAGYLRDPVDSVLQLTPDRTGQGRSAMEINFAGQFVTGGLNVAGYIVLPAPAYGKSAGFHRLPDGFTPWAINNFGHVAGIMAADRTVAIWTNGPLRNIGKLPGYADIINVDMNIRDVVVGTAATIVGDSVQSAAFIAGPTEAGLRKLFPNAIGSTAVARINSSADVVGLEISGHAGRGFFTAGGDSLKPRNAQYLDDLDLEYPAHYPEVINLWGDVAGLVFRFAPPPLGGGWVLSSTRQMFTFATRGMNDLPGGVSLPSPVTPAEVFALNARGQLLCSLNYANLFYENGSFKLLEDLIAPESGWSSEFGRGMAGADLNDNGWIIGTGKYLGQSGHVFWMIPNGPDARASVSPLEIAVGELATYSLTLSNSTAATGKPITVAQVRPILHPSDDVGLATVVSGPTPDSVATLAPGKTATFTWTYKGTLAGPTRLFSQGASYDPTAKTVSYTNLFSEHVFALLKINGLSGTIQVTPTRAELDDTVVVTLSAKNQGNSTITAVAPSLFATTGAGQAAVISGPIPPSVATLAVGASTNFVYQFRASAEGRVNFRARIAGKSSAGATIETGDLLASILIGPKGDLLIRNADGSSPFAGNDLYSEILRPEQGRTNTVALSQPSQFQVQVQNDGKRPQIFRLAAIEDPTLTGWDLKYLFNGQEITSQIRTLGGVEFAELQPGGSYNVTVQMIATNFTAKTPQRVSFALNSPKFPTETLDVVEAVTFVPRVEVRAIEVAQTVQDWLNSVPLIAGKATLVRVFFQAPPGSTETISGVRGHLRGYRKGTELFFSPLPPSARPREAIAPLQDISQLRASLKDSLNFELPRDWTTDELSLKFEPENVVAEFKEPAEPGGAPADGILNLKFKPMPALPIVFHFTTEFNKDGVGRRADLSQVKNLVQLLIADFPVANLNWSFGSELLIEHSEIPEVEEFYKVYDQIRTDPSYLSCSGLMKCPLGQALLPIFSENGDDIQIGGGLAEAIPGVLSTARLGFTTPEFTSQAAAHELGHCLGRPHTFPAFAEPITDGPSTLFPGTCGEFAAFDSAPFPYYERVADEFFAFRPVLGPLSHGADSQVYGSWLGEFHEWTILNPNSHFDLMSYCSRRVTWPSKYTYERLMDAIQLRFGSPQAPLTALHALATAAPGAMHLIIRGAVDLAQNTAELMPVRRLPAPEGRQMPGPGPYSLVLLNKAGAALQSFSFVPSLPTEGGSKADIFFIVPEPANFGGIEIRKGDAPLLTRVANNPPVVKVLSPNGGELLDTDQVTIRWQAQDAEGDSLRYFVDYSPDNGATWTGLASDRRETQCTVPRYLLKGSNTGLIRVEGSDGLLSSSDVSDTTFRVKDNPPIVLLLSEPALLNSDQRALLQATVFDPEDGNLSGANIAWSSSVNGVLGSGLTLEVAASQLRLGAQQITVTATDTFGNHGQASADVAVTTQSAPFMLHPRVMTGAIQFELLSELAATNVVQTSLDFAQWSAALTNVASRASETVTLPATGARLFIRAVRQ
jgi:hypothetical protein